MKQFTISLGLVILLLAPACTKTGKRSFSGTSPSFTMVFMTDIHLQPELNAVEGFRKAIDSVNSYHPDLVITGGDLIMDALAVKQTRADSLFDLYSSQIKQLKMPVYNTVGNHELFGVYPQSGVDTTHELYGNKMFQQRFGKKYYSVTHKNWKFFVLDAVQITPQRRYTGNISPEQLEWLRKELFNTSPKMPVAIVTHIPFLTSTAQFKKGPLAANSEGLVVANAREVLNLFAGYNLRLVLQGHLHVLEDNFIGNIHFITGGAVSGGWWKGAHEGTGEGFLVLKFTGDEFTWKYVDYGWNPVGNK